MPNHWSFPSRHMFTASSTIATQYPHAAGIAYTLRHQGIPGVAIVAGGEGSTSEGDWHEAMNFASIRRLPVVFIIENNHYAISVREENEVAGSIAERARSYGMEAESIDGNDALAVYATTRDAIERARGGGGPSLIEAQTYRHHGHSRADPGTYRPKEEIDAWMDRDPIPMYHQRLLRMGVGEEQLTSITQQVSAAVQVATDEATNGALPDLASIYTDVWADGGWTWRN